MDQLLGEEPVQRIVRIGTHAARFLDTAEDTLAVVEIEDAIRLGRARITGRQVDVNVTRTRSQPAILRNREG